MGPRQAELPGKNAGSKPMERRRFLMPLFRAVRTERNQPGITGVAFDHRPQNARCGAVAISVSLIAVTERSVSHHLWRRARVRSAPA
jgi:hypothetical protein